MIQNTRLLMVLTALFTFCGSKVQAQDETIVFTPQWTAQAMEIIDDGIPLVNILQTSMNNAINSE